MSQQVGNRRNAPLKRSRPNKKRRQIITKSKSDSEKYSLSLSEIFGGPRSLSQRKRITNSIQCGNHSFEISFYIRSPNQQHESNNEKGSYLVFAIQRNVATESASIATPRRKKRKLVISDDDTDDSDSNQADIFLLKVHVQDQNENYNIVYEHQCCFKSRGFVDLTQNDSNLDGHIALFPVESLQSIAARYSLSINDEESRCAECGGISRTNNSIMIHFKCCDIYYHLHCAGKHYSSDSESSRQLLVESIDGSGSCKRQCPRCITLKPPNYRSLAKYVIYLRFEIDAISDDKNCSSHSDEMESDSESFSNLLSQIQTKYQQSVDKWKGGELKMKQLSITNKGLIQKNDHLKATCDQWFENNKALKEKVKVYMDRCQESHEQNIKITKRSKELCDDNQKLIGTVDSLQKKVNLFEGKTEALNRLTMKELDDLHIKLQESMRSLQDQREKKLEQEYQCRLCFDRRKNVYFIDGCDHVEICGHCASTMGIKQCPRCTASFSEFKVLNIY